MSKHAENVLPSLGAILAQTIGSANNWTETFPAYAEAKEVFNTLPSKSVDAITNGGYRYDMDPVGLFRKTPQKLWGHPDVLEEWLDLMDISHKKL